MPDSEQHPPTERPPISGHARAAFALGVVSGIGGGVCWLAMWLHWTDWQLPLWLDVPLVLAAFAAPFAVLATVVAAISALVETWRPRGQVRGTALAVAAILLCIPYPAAIVGAMYQKEVERGRTQACASNLHALVKAMHMYLEDNDNTFPPANTWCDELKGYLDDESAFVCPAAPTLRCGYAYNSALSGLRYEAILEPHDVVAFFESDAGWNASGGPELLPKRPRHGRIDVYSFGDGSTIGHAHAFASELQWQPTLRPPSP